MWVGHTLPVCKKCSGEYIIHYQAGNLDSYYALEKGKGKGKCKAIP
jgi:hypothetical protein